MIDIGLMSDETIVLQQLDAYLLGNKDRTLDELVLTNKRLIWGWREKENGLLSKTVNKTSYIYLNDIKIIDSTLQLKVIEVEDYEYALQVISDSRVLITFESDDIHRDCIKWYENISEVVASSKELKSTLNEVQNNKFCMYCGKKLDKNDLKFCTSCGASLDN